MHWWGFNTCPAGGWLGIFFWIVVMILIIVLVVKLLYSRNTSSHFPGKSEDPLEILKRRYARGEISYEEYDRMKKELSQN